ncbi:MAG TPA: capsule assembly Wzi family protein [Woeseiaceae bacterium]|nr:capsule assembly Wzi family protein [Woeseiaceae bacterium]
MTPTRPDRARPGAPARMTPALAAKLLAGLAAGLGAAAAGAGPMLPAGDMGLRSDIQYLADHGIVTGPVSTWPLAWAPIARDVNAADPTNLPSHLAEVVLRVQARAEQAAGQGRPEFSAELAGADNPARIRGFEDTPRGDVDARAGLDWQQGRFAADVNVQYVDTPDNGNPWVDVVQDDDEVRFDDTLLAVSLGNWSIGASTQQRWWGPGWDGNLILTNNARPIPALVIDRVFTDAFETKWLSWIGPWDLSAIFGRFESERAVPDAHFFGMRFSMRPFQSLELGASRSAQLCGEGRPCGFDTYWDMFLGRDNVGDAGIDEENEPGNQLAGFDARWNPGFWERSLAFYAQFIGEDAADFFPSRYMGQAGFEWSGYLENRWSARFFTEYADTNCQFYDAETCENLAYNHNIYETGYRYKGRVVGHGADGDSELLSIGWVMTDPDATEWRVLLRGGKLNVEGEPDLHHSLTPTEQEIASIDIAHARAFGFGRLELGLGYEQLDDLASGEDEGDARVYLQWTSHPGFAGR